jgi:hypothetical protein
MPGPGYNEPIALPPAPARVGSCCFRGQRLLPQPPSRLGVDWASPSRPTPHSCSLCQPRMRARRGRARREHQATRGVVEEEDGPALALSSWADGSEGTRGSVARAAAADPTGRALFLASRHGWDWEGGESRRSHGGGEFHCCCCGLSAVTVDRRRKCLTRGVRFSCSKGSSDAYFC